MYCIMREFSLILSPTALHFYYYVCFWSGAIKLIRVRSTQKWGSEKYHELYRENKRERINFFIFTKRVREPEQCYTQI